MIVMEGMTLTNRDHEILKMILEMKFMTLDQIARMFFPESKNVYKVPLRRINLLMRKGLLRSVRPIVGHKSLYLVTKLGAKLLKEKNLSRLRALDHVCLNLYEHDLLVTDLRILFAQRLGFKRWISERVLQGERRKARVPDGVVSNGKQKFLIEVELSLKNKSRYQKIFSFSHPRYSDYEAILYVMGNDAQMEWLMREADSRNDIYFITRKTLEQAVDGAEFIRWKGSLYLSNADKSDLEDALGPEIPEGLQEFMEADGTTIFHEQS